MLAITNLAFSYPAHRGAPVDVFQGLSLTVPQGRILALLGPSGCGKTTTLMSVAGLLTPLSGRILFGDQVYFCGDKAINLSASQRKIGLMFQSYAIWPHMTVFENAAFPLTVGPDRQPTHRVRAQTLAMLERLGLVDYAQRKGTDLSGGQQQRLALARALINRPKLMLLDEPLSNVEPALRISVKNELRAIQRETGVTMLFITHDHTDALALADEVAVMQQGRIVQQGTPRDVYSRPATPFVANFVGRSILLPITATDENAREGSVLYAYRSPVGPLRLAPINGKTGYVSIKQSEIRLHAAAPPDGRPNVFAVNIESIEYLGHTLELQMRCNTTELRARCSPSVDLQPGDSAWLEFEPGKCVVFEGHGNDG